MTRRITRIYYALAYYASWAWFGLGGCAVNLLSLPLLPWRKSPRVNRLVRRAVRVLFRQWVFWFRTSRMLLITWRGFARPATATATATMAATAPAARGDGGAPPAGEDGLAKPASASTAPAAAPVARPGTVFIANHPTLIDAPLLLARLPADTVCIFKPALMRNPAIGPAAIVGGHASGTGGIDLVRDLAGRIAGGLSLLIFPEGTRTDAGAALNPLKPGFALIANRAGAPVRLVRIRSSRGLVPRGRAWWKPPAMLPATLEFALDREWPHDPRKPAAALTAEIEAYLRAELEKEAGR
ncbi:MAG: 1-acyl-sn-glycerol-3-phosphate acyltransferase [Opitutaceae bacterium]|jgi:1-acyl-sn-glycerol-3-phosphate acyltransferase|nr:1-acyl-sn-glycerol-3-phosphate acyltransferase [Opitutaceae bacterium]